MKPIWHTGPWSEEQTQDLIAELLLAEQTRSLTNEEQHWLEDALSVKIAAEIFADLQKSSMSASLVKVLQKSPNSN